MRSIYKMYIKLKKDYYINHVSTYDKDDNMYLDDNSIVYIIFSIIMLMHYVLSVKGQDNC